MLKRTRNLIAAYLEAVIQRDASAVDRYFDPNVEYIVNGTPSRDGCRLCRRPRVGWVPTVSIARRDGNHGQIHCGT